MQGEPGPPSTNIASSSSGAARVGDGAGGRTAKASDLERGLREPDLPRVDVSWYQVQAYCRWLTLQSLTVELPARFAARLPSEEWEKAARGSDGREYPWGDGFAVDPANVSGIHPDLHLIVAYLGEMPVATYPLGASPCGAWDMVGNVWEWQRDRYDDKDLDNKSFALRGGSYYVDPRSARCASRRGGVPGNRFEDRGFRVALSQAVSRS